MTFGCQGALMSQCSDTGVLTLSPGDYTFSLYVYDSEEGSAGGSFSYSAGSETPEPGTVASVASVLLLGLCHKPKLKLNKRTPRCRVDGIALGPDFPYNRDQKIQFAGPAPRAHLAEDSSNPIRS
jgi:hypothetical protein